MKPSLVLLALAAVLAAPARVSAEEAWETAARQAIEHQDQELKEAGRRGTLGQVANRYGSRVSRQPTPLNHFLLGRSLYYAGDPEGAERHLQKALELDPGFWMSRIRLAVLKIEQQQNDQARRLLGEVLRVRPNEPDALKLSARIHLEAQEYDAALAALRRLLDQDPTNDDVRRNVAIIHMTKEDWPAALAELRILSRRAPDDLQVRQLMGAALHKSGDALGASREYEMLLRMTRDQRRLQVMVLDELRIVYLDLEDREALTRTFERMLPLADLVAGAQQVDEEEVRQRILSAIEALKAGAPLTEQEARPDAEEGWTKARVQRLVERCIDDDVSVRRMALQAYFENKIPFMESVLIRRVSVDLEPDRLCRAWILRIIGSLMNERLAQIAAYGLYDPELLVRTKAAEALGDIGSSSGLLYLLPFLLTQAGPEGITEIQEQEFNAAREAVIRITGRRDAQGSESTWVPRADVPRIVADWQAWLVSPEGKEARLEAIQSLGELGDLRPELYLLDDVADPDPEISRAAYRVLLARAQTPPAEEEEEDVVPVAMWPRFPRYEDAQLTDEGVVAMREAVAAWWEAWRAMRKRLSTDGG